MGGFWPPAGRRSRGWVSKASSKSLRPLCSGWLARSQRSTRQGFSEHIIIAILNIIVKRVQPNQVFSQSQSLSNRYSRRQRSMGPDVRCPRIVPAHSRLTKVVPGFVVIIPVDLWPTDIGDGGCWRRKFLIDLAIFVIEIRYPHSCHQFRTLSPSSNQYHTYITEWSLFTVLT